MGHGITLGHTVCAKRLSLLGHGITLGHKGSRKMHRVTMISRLVSYQDTFTLLGVEPRPLPNRGSVLTTTLQEVHQHRTGSGGGAVPLYPFPPSLRSG